MLTSFSIQVCEITVQQQSSMSEYIVFEKHLLSVYDKRIFI